MTVWPDGFVNLEELLVAECKYSRRGSWQELFERFRRSYMNTPIDDSGVRMKIMYLAKEKNWVLSPDCSTQRRAPLQGFSRLCTTQTGWGVLEVGFDIRAEGGMSESIHRRVLMDLYRDRYVPGHPTWQDSVIHGTDHREVPSILDIGLVPGGIKSSELKRRSEIHLVTNVVKRGKTPGVRRGSSAYIYVDMKRMYEDGIELF